MGKDQKGTEWQTERAGGSTDKGFSVDAKDWVATGGVENPGRSSVLADIQSGGRLPSGQQKTCLITGASSGLGLHTAKVLVKTGDWRVICVVRNPDKMKQQAEALEFPEGSYDVVQCDLNSLDAVNKLCDGLIAKKTPLDCVLGNAAVYYPMRKDPRKFRLGFHMAGAGALPANQLAEDALQSPDGYEETMQVNHFSHFLLFNRLVDYVSAYGKRANHTPRMVIVGSITHNPDELAGKIPPQADLGDLRGFRGGFQVSDGNIMADGGKFDGPKAYKDSKVASMLTIFEMHKRFHESKGIIFNTMYPGCIAETPLCRNHDPAFQQLFPAFQKYVTGGYISVEEAGERLASVCCDPEYEKSGCYWSWTGGVRGANGATQSYNKDEKGMGGKIENRVSAEVRNEALAVEVWDESEILCGLKDASGRKERPAKKEGGIFAMFQ